MDFMFSGEQQQFGNNLERFLHETYGFDKRRLILRGEAGWSREIWQQFAEMGVLALSLPEEGDGFGGNGFDTLLVMETLGRHLALEPYLATVVLGAGLLADAGNADQRRSLLPPIAAGESLWALAHEEAGQRYGLSSIATTARRNGDGYRLDGKKIVVLHGGEADRLLVSARTAGTERDAYGISLFQLDANTAGVERFAYPTHDGRRAANIRLDGVYVSESARLGAEHQACAVIEKGMDRGIAALCAEAVGCMTTAIKQTAVYLKTRKQFGVAIGSFQGLQHRLADMYLHAEQARSMAYLAAARLDAERDERRRAVSAAKVLVGQSARFVAQQAVQLHGGIGMTDELAISHLFKRLTMIGLQFGDVDYHLDQFGRQLPA